MSPLRFGVFPLGAAGTPDGVATGPADDLQQVAAALDRLAGQRRPWLVRMYVGWTGSDSMQACLDHMAWWADQPWDLDIVLCYRDRTANVDGWVALVTEAITRWGDRFSTLQITSEADLTSMPGAADGDFPGVADALVQGVSRAAALKGDLGAAVEVGFAVTFDPHPGQHFLWPRFANSGGETSRLLWITPG